MYSTLSLRLINIFCTVQAYYLIHFHLVLNILTKKEYFTNKQEKRS
jgi:hypothetical protein